MHEHPDGHAIWLNTVTRYDVLREVEVVTADEVKEVAAKLGIKSLNGRYERKEARRIISTLIVRTGKGDSHRRERLHHAMAVFADRPQTEDP